MTDVNIAALLQRHDMGQAYLAITDQMGPSAQLLAFVNYENVSADNVGLESFDIMDQHAQILAEIDADPALPLACEGLAANLKSLAEKVKNAITFNKADPLHHFLQGKVEPKDSSITVAKASDVNRAFDCFKIGLDNVLFLLPIIPGSNDPADWMAFYEKYVKDKNSSELTKHHRDVEKANSYFKDLGKKVEFKSSGWDLQNFRKAITALTNATKQYEDKEGKLTDAIDHIDHTLALVESTHHIQKVDQYNRRKDIVDTVENSTKKKDDPTKKHVLHDAVEKGLNEAERHQRAQQHEALMKLMPSHMIAGMNAVYNSAHASIWLMTQSHNKILKWLTDVSRHYKAE